MGVYLPLPNEYQEVEYIQSDRSVGQYIHTNIIPTNTTGLYMRVSSQNVTNDGVYCGAATNNTDTGQKFGLGNTRSKIYYGWNRWSEDSYRPSASTNTIVELENNYMNSRVFKKDGVIYTDGSGNASYSNTLSTINYPINIFGHNGANTAQYFSSIKLYNLKVSNGSNIIADFVPCYRKSDNVIGLYDLVNNQFYTNAGTGTFTKGADVTAVPLKNAYIGEYTEAYEYTYDFTTGSTSDLQSKGWTVPSGSVVNSSGYYNSSKNWNAMTITPPQLQTAVQTATKVIYWLSWTASGNHQRDFNLASGSTNLCTFYGDGVSSSGGNQAFFGGESLLNESGYTYGRSGTFTTTITVDLVNKTWKYEGTNHATLTGTVTDTAITNFRTVDGLKVYGEQTAYITSIGVKIS